MSGAWTGLQAWHAGDGTTCVSLFIDGKVIALVPNELGSSLSPGWYDFDLNPVPNPFTELIDILEAPVPPAVTERQSPPGQTAHAPSVDAVGP